MEELEGGWKEGGSVGMGGRVGWRNWRGCGRREFGNGRESGWKELGEWASGGEVGEWESRQVGWASGGEVGGEVGGVRLNVNAVHFVLTVVYYM